MLLHLPRRRKRHSCHARRERGPLHPLTLLLRNNNRRHDHRSCSRLLLHRELVVKNGRLEQSYSCLELAVAKLLAPSWNTMPNTKLTR